MIAFLNVAVLCLLSILILCVINAGITQWIVAIVLSALICLQLASLYAGGSLIDYKFVVHANWHDVSSMIGLYGIESMLLVFLFLTLPFVLQFIVRRTQALQAKLTRKHIFTIMAVSLTVMMLKGGVISNGYGVLKVLTARSMDFELALHNLEMSSYVPMEEIQATPGRNIIILSLESYEKGFLSDKNGALTPHLQQLAKKWTMIDMKETLGCNWTSGSLYGMMTGLPAFFKGDGNSVFQNSSATKVANVGHILKSAGYQTTFLIGDGTFAGTSDLLKVFEFGKIIDAQNIAENYGSAFTTARDKDLFDAAKIEVSNAKKSGKPFALMLSTLDTHNPNGLYDKRFESILRPQPTDLEFMVSAVDHMIGNFIDFLEEKKLLENTTVFIFPDHLKMGDASLFQGTGERGLFILTNASKEKLDLQEIEPVYQIDLPKIILNGAQVEHNARFLSEYIEEDKDEFVKSHTAELTSLNHAGLIRDNVWDDDLRIVKVDGGLQVLFADTIIHIPSDTMLTNLTRINFSPEQRLHSIETLMLTREALSGFPAGLAVNVYQKNDSIVACLQMNSRIPIAKVDKNKIIFTQNDIATVKRNLSQVDPDKALDTFFNWEETETWTISGAKGKDYSEVAITVPYVANEGLLILTYTADDNAKPFIILFNQPYTPAKVLIHDEIPGTGTKNTVRFPIRGLTEDNLLIFRNWSSSGNFVVHNYNVVGIGRSSDIRLNTPSGNTEVLKRDVSRFIAHAGGAIDNITYTNSLEALEANYSKGFRLFELDIIKTSDGRFVAAHDWKYWAGLTGYVGASPPSAADFLNYKILGKYTPLDMNRINQWFSNHKDAILVTDKVNEPRVFAQQFVDRKRLMMELFTLDAVREGVATGMLSAMPSQNVISELGTERTAMLKKLGVNAIAISRLNIRHYIPFLQRLKKAGIKVYAFDINHEPGKDENFTITFEMEYIYGIYADRWDFGNK